MSAHFFTTSLHPRFAQSGTYDLRQGGKAGVGQALTATAPPGSREPHHSQLIK